jgi:glycosyltransferase involved in cell wall biosynthesis
MALLTVGIPVFNAMPYLPESLNSILGQSYRDFQVLAINDGSTDGSWEYLQTVRDPRLRLVNQDNRGITATLNRMLSEVDTAWLARHDADDVAYPNRLERTAAYIEKYPDAGMFFSLAEYFPKGSVGMFRSTKGTPQEIRKLVQSGYLPAICHPSVTLNVRKAVAVGGYRFDLHVEDIDLWWRLALAEDLRFIPEALVGFRQNLASVSSANLAHQAVNTLYIQYLLISHVLKRTALPYEQARPELAELFDDRRLEFKTHLRAFNMALGHRQYAQALLELNRAFGASPIDFLNRVLDEFAGHREISLGENPETLLRARQSLWPENPPQAAEPAPREEVFSERT